jgi:hypothetical protein
MRDAPVALAAPLAIRLGAGASFQAVLEHPDGVNAAFAQKSCAAQLILGPGFVGDLGIFLMPNISGYQVT